MALQPLSDALQTGSLLADGAMGTQLMAAGLQPGECPELWNVEHADRVREIHDRYLQAGSNLILTNTFGGNRITLDRHGLGDRTVELNQAAARLAGEAVRAADHPAYVLGDIGPTGAFLEPLGEVTEEQMLAVFEEQAGALAAGGVAGLIVETMTDPQEMRLAITAARKAADLPVIASFAFDPAGEAFRTMMGTTVDDAVAAALDAGASVVGANCGTNLSLDQYVELARQLVAAVTARGEAPVILQANAGSPEMVDGRLVHPAAPQDMADLLRKLRQVGVGVIGGCCGTTPDHLRAMAAALA